MSSHISALTEMAAKLSSLSASRAPTKKRKMRTIVWNDDTLDEWIKDPQHFIPENTMTFPGMKDARFIGAQRDRVIATYTLLAATGRRSGGSR